MSRRRSYGRRYIRQRSRNVTKLNVDVDAVQKALAKFGQCAHSRVGGFACPHCHGFGIPGQERDRPIAIVDKEQQRVTFLDENGEPTGTSPFTTGSSKITVYRVHRLDGKIEEF